MTMDRKRTDKIIEQFRDREFFYRSELLEFYRQFEPDLDNRTFGWRVFELKKNNVIKSVGRGIYSISSKENFTPVPDKKMKKIYNAVLNSYKIYGREWESGNWLSIWNINWLNEFLLHQTFTDYYIVEADLDAAENVFFEMQNKGFKKIFYDPDEELLEKNIINESGAIVVKSLFSRSPIQSVDKIKVPALEKILVDLFTETNFYYAFQGEQLVEIYSSAIDKYNLNYSKLFNYAKRRRKGHEIKGFLKSKINTDIPIELT